MGYANDNILQAMARATRKGNEAEKKRLRKLFLASQTECPHDPKDSRLTKIPKNTGTGKFKRGGTFDYCRRCSVIVHYYPPGIEVPKKRPTVWDALLSNDFG